MFISSAKIMKPNGEKLDKFQSEIFYIVLELEMNSDLKTQLWELNITAAKATEVSVGQKALLIFVLIPQVKYFQKFQVWLLHDLEKFSGKHIIYLVCPSEITGKRICKKLNGSWLTKVHLDKTQQNNVEHKVETFSGICKKLMVELPNGSVVRNLPANARDMGSIPGLGRFHMPWGN
ncbi:hypothetical protein FD754_002579 [Muntiacus muntjak]|uniref:40S ribosomal protein S7 n=1 Tax=Muntiacus muntjak TaxID=9888 RepID=A0A5N3WAD0_MUNMU|nr:hypothetical protein FD754_002579 [Muntiacus muntjak]